MLSNRRFLPHCLHRQQRFLIAVLAPLLHIVHPAVHDHQDDAREQLLHLASRHPLVEHLTEKINGVCLERAIEIKGECLQLQLYLVELVAIVVGARLAGEDFGGRIHEEA